MNPKKFNSLTPAQRDRYLMNEEQEIFKGKVPAVDFNSVVVDPPGNTKLIKAKFCCGGSPDFEGYYNPDENWNGWKCPYFSVEIVKQIADFFEGNHIEVKSISCSIDNFNQLFGVCNEKWCWEVSI